MDTKGYPYNNRIIFMSMKNELYIKQLGYIKQLVYMTWKDWEKMGRIGYGKSYRNEYSLAEKGYIYIYTDECRLDYPDHILYIEETKEIVFVRGNMTLAKFALVDQGDL